MSEFHSASGDWEFFPDPLTPSLGVSREPVTYWNPFLCIQDLDPDLVLPDIEVPLDCRMCSESIKFPCGWLWGYEPDQARQILAARGDWPKRSASFSAEEAEFSFIVLAATQDLGPEALKAYIE